MEARTRPLSIFCRRVIRPGNATHRLSERYAQVHMQACIFLEGSSGFGHLHTYSNSRSLSVAKRRSPSPSQSHSLCTTANRATDLVPRLTPDGRTDRFLFTARHTRFIMPAAIQHMSDGLGARLDCAESGYGGHAIQEGRYVNKVYPSQYLNIHITQTLSRFCR